MRKWAWLLAACTVLASCGGDDGGSAGGSGASSSTGSTSSSKALNTGEIKPTADATYIAATMELTTTAGSSNQTTAQTVAGTTFGRSTTINTPQFTGSYSAQAGYHLADAMNSAVFGPGQLTGDTTSSSQNPTVTFASIVSPVENYLALYKESVTTTSSKGSGTVAPQYGGVGGWQHTVVNGSSRSTRLDYFAFGPATPVANMPHTGVVKFFSNGGGNYATDTSLYFTAQPTEIDVDFAAGTVSGNLTVSGQDLFVGGVAGLIALRIPGTIQGNAVDAPISSDIATVSGRFHLTFVGPNADELILTYVAQDGTRALVGASVGVRDPYL